MPPADRDYKVHEFAAKENVGVHTVLAWIANGSLSATNVARDPKGRRPRWRISHEAVRAWELARQSQPPLPRRPRRRKQSEVVEFYR